MKSKKGMNRRQFIKNSTIGVMGAGIANEGSKLLADEKSPTPITKIKAYRKLGLTGFLASDIALGGVSNVEVIRAMLDAGVNYIDTAETYERGKSEISMGQAIKDRDRKSLFITTKLHINEDESKESILTRAKQCLQRLDTEYIDCLMTHNPSFAELVKYEPFHQACDQLKKEGKLKFVGISSHGSRHGRKQDPMDKVLLGAAEDGRFSVMLLVYNFIQREMAERVLAVCQEKKIGVTLMKTNPVGRYLGMKERIEEMKKSEDQDPERMKRMQSYFDNLKKTAEKGDWFIKKYNLTDNAEIRTAATRYVLANPKVTTVLARTRSFEDMDQFLKASGTNISESEIKKLAAFERGPGKFYCRHACGLCESCCPHEIPINTIMRYNHYFDAQRNEKYALEKYAALNSPMANLCETCDGMCQNKCPFGVPIQGLLAMAHQNLCLNPA